MPEVGAMRLVPGQGSGAPNVAGYEGCLCPGMGNYASNTKLDQLTLVDGPDMAAPTVASPAPQSAVGGTLELSPVPAAPARAAVPASPTPAAQPAAVAPGKPVPLQGRNTGESYDPFMTEAREEFERGHVEQPLWVRSLAQAEGKVEAAKPAYLRARAIALRLERRSKRAESPSQRDHGSTARHPTDRRLAAPAPGTLDRKRIALVAGVVAVLIAGVVFLLVWPSSTPPAPATVAPKAPVAATHANDAKAADPNKGAAMSTEDFAAKIQSFKDAGNWNVLVLYAVEWTRKEPSSAQAWKELGSGYLRMKQYDDALDATRKAVQISPTMRSSGRTSGRSTSRCGSRRPRSPRSRRRARSTSTMSRVARRQVS